MQIIRRGVPFIVTWLTLRKDRRMKRRQRTRVMAFAVLFVALALAAGPTFAQEKKPNIVIIWGDDIGQSNISAYTKGLMGYRTPTSTVSPMKA